tara:strand:+ start:145 stop:402 length:258 start_codon:yes stop_codon:yes gene_type:complete
VGSRVSATATSGTGVRVPQRVGRQCTNYEKGEIRTIGSDISRFLNLQNQKLSCMACERCEACGYAEFYRMDGKGGLDMVVDILSN